ncbi:MAG: tetratricopeptide repeat protein [Chthoniobacterales bacterium]
MNGLLRTLCLATIFLAIILCGCASQEQKNPTDPLAQVRLGDKYTRGTWTIAKNDESAADWYRKAALQGDAEGQYHLGLCYDRGLGVPKNTILALEWYRKSARQGNTAAQYELGTCYRLAKGVAPDLCKAYMWFNLAAASGSENAREAREAVAHRLTAEQIRKAEHMSREEWEHSR